MLENYDAKDENLLSYPVTEEGEATSAGADEHPAEADHDNGTV